MFRGRLSQLEQNKESPANEILISIFFFEKLYHRINLKWWYRIIAETCCCVRNNHLQLPE